MWYLVVVYRLFLATESRLCVHLFQVNAMILCQQHNSNNVRLVQHSFKDKQLLSHGFFEGKFYVFL